MEKNMILAEDTEENEILLPTVIQYFGDIQKILEKYSHCPQCKSHLHISHRTDFNKNLTQEVKRCPECELQATHTLFILQ